jgi:tetratricopeptide (TPR) repeat protein
VSKRILAAVAIVVLGGGGFLLFKRLWPSSPEIKEPAGLDRTVPEVRDYVRSRIDRAREDPKDVGKLTDLAIALGANGFWADALPVFEAVASRTPDDPLPAYYAARARSETGQATSAKESLEDLVAKFPKFGPGRYALGSALLEGGDVDGAMKQFGELAAMAGPEAGWGQAGLANAMLRKGKAQQAADLLEPVVRREPGFAQANFLLGRAYRDLGRIDAANRHLSQGIRASEAPMPDSWSARLSDAARTPGGRISYAQGLHEAGKTNDGIAVLESLRESHPDDLELLSNLGAFYLHVNQDEKARDVLLRAEKLNPRHLPTLYNLVAVEIRMKAFESALARAGRAVDLAPAHRQSHVARADVLFAMDRLPAAVDALREAIRVDPGNANLRFRIGVMLGRLARYQEARTELDLATRMEPGYAAAWVLLAESSIRLGLAREARAAFEQAERLDPKMEEIKGMDQRIRALEQR